MNHWLIDYYWSLGKNGDKAISDWFGGTIWRSVRYCPFHKLESRSSTITNKPYRCHWQSDAKKCGSQQLSSRLGELLARRSDFHIDMIAEVLFYHLFQDIAFGLTVYYRDSSSVKHTVLYLR